MVGQRRSRNCLSREICAVNLSGLLISDILMALTLYIISVSVPDMLCMAWSVYTHNFVWGGVGNWAFVAVCL